MKEEELEKLAREGKLQNTLRELERIYAIWQKMERRHRKIFADLIAAKPEAKNSIEAVIKKEDELTTKFREDIKQIQKYLAEKEV